jgi:hypothetical protein
MAPSVTDRMDVEIPARRQEAIEQEAKAVAGLWVFFRP